MDMHKVFVSMVKGIEEDRRFFMVTVVTGDFNEECDDRCVLCIISILFLSKYGIFLFKQKESYGCGGIGGGFCKGGEG
ncbi:MAG TPA: hypothetical protein VI278_03405 [Nitrososphaeraceae archaeon]|jgi:hypothetical protein